eukprot:TRINITY_DN65543_c0_g1_i1.p1 TRINITY_DN65543_c0_g1~~TRINITY_DN65543_c0_g1_i1.p1  ORF type:complete len:248 (+),score=31.81 TRINITY_DN65543_c0_g1_i1:118-861(+)
MTLNHGRYFNGCCLYEEASEEVSPPDTELSSLCTNEEEYKALLAVLGRMQRRGDVSRQRPKRPIESALGRAMDMISANQESWPQWMSEAGFSEHDSIGNIPSQYGRSMDRGSAASPSLGISGEVEDSDVSSRQSSHSFKDGDSLLVAPMSKATLLPSSSLTPPCQFCREKQPCMFGSAHLSESDELQGFLVSLSSRHGISLMNPMTTRPKLKTQLDICVRAVVADGVSGDVARLQADVQSDVSTFSI